MTRRIVRIVSLALGIALVAAGEPIRITGQLLAYQQGYVFFSTGDGFRVSPSIAINDAATGKPSRERPRPRLYARATFDGNGVVTELDLSHRVLPPEADYSAVQKFAVAASTPAPNPDLAGPQIASNGIARTFSGKPVLVVISVQVPPNTPLTSTVYLTTDASGWNPQAIQMQRVDALHFQVTRHLNSGTVFTYLYTRGSLQSEERAENGLERTPRNITINDADVRAVNDIVYQWADATSGGQSAQPNAIPTPYNPAPFPNLPAGAPTPHPQIR